METIFIRFIILLLQVLDQGQTGSVWYLHKHGDQAIEIPQQFSTFDDLLKLNE
jgi:hypothetical protein